MEFTFTHKLFNPPQTSSKHADIPNVDVGTHPIFALDLSTIHLPHHGNDPQIGVKHIIEKKTWE